MRTGVELIHKPAIALGESKPPVVKRVDFNFDPIFIKYGLVYHQNYNTKNKLTRFFRWIYNVNPLLAQHAPDKIRQNEIGIIPSFQAALDDLKHKSARMNWISRWLVDLKPLITLCEISLKETSLLRDEIFFAKMHNSRSLEYKRFSTRTIKQAITDEVYISLSQHFGERDSLIQVIVASQAGELIPTEKITYFNRGVGFPIRYVHPRVSGGKKKNYPNLMAEIKASEEERRELAKNCPENYDVNLLCRNATFQAWSDLVDDCHARRAYAEAAMKIAKINMSEFCQFTLLPLNYFQASMPEEAKCDENSNRASAHDPEFSLVGYFNHPIENISGIKSLVMDYLGEDNKFKKFACHNPFKLFGHRFHEILMNLFLQQVVYGEQQQAEIILTYARQSPNLLLQFLTTHGSVVDYSGRKFNQITAFQYAVWAMDWHMWKMILPFFDSVRARKVAATQLKELEEMGTEHGAHYSLLPLLHALEAEHQFFIKYENRQTPYTTQQKNACSAQLNVNWCVTVGMLQQQLPAHIVNEYCRGRPFAPLKPTTFWERSLPRGQIFYNQLAKKRQLWFSGEPVEQSTTSESSAENPRAKLGTHFAISRGKGTPVGHSTEQPAGDYIKSLDLAALRRLWEVRNKNLLQLKRRLLEKTPELTVASINSLR